MKVRIIVLQAGALLFLGAARGSGQDDPPQHPRDALERLRSDDIRVRESAGRRLGDLPSDRLPMLRELLAGESDPEVRARLSEAIDRISLREAERLYQAGRLEETLRWLAEGDGDDLQVNQSVYWTKQAVAEEIRAWFPGMPNCTDDYPPELSGVAVSIEERFGPWGTAVLLEALESEDTTIPAFGLLQELGDDNLPALGYALERGGPQLQKDLCMVIYGMIFVRGRTPLDRSGLTVCLARMVDDAGTDAGTRFRCRQLLGWFWRGALEAGTDLSEVP
jgi:hypothetical protein